MKNVLKLSVATAVLAVSLNGFAANTKAPGTQVAQGTPAAAPAATPAPEAKKKLNKKEAKETCLKENGKMKGKELKSCVKEKMSL